MIQWIRKLFMGNSPSERIDYGNEEDNERYEAAWRSLEKENNPIRLAWLSGDIGKMLEVSDLDGDPLDQHLLWQAIIEDAYKQREKDNFRRRCAEYCEIHLANMDRITPALLADIGKMPRILTFQYYSTILTEAGKFDDALEVCERAIRLELSDGTKDGFKGRMKRIENKRKKMTT